MESHYWNDAFLARANVSVRILLVPAYILVRQIAKKKRFFLSPFLFFFCARSHELLKTNQRSWRREGRGWLLERGGSNWVIRIESSSSSSYSRPTFCCRCRRCCCYSISWTLHAAGTYECTLIWLLALNKRKEREKERRTQKLSL